jgi:hypothetical protein
MNNDLPLIPKDAKDVKGFRSFFENVRSQACSMAATTTGPLKQVWDDLAAKYASALETLPKEADGNWSVIDKIDCFFNSLVSANAAASVATLELSKANSATASTLASAATNEIARQIGTGDLIPKADLAAKIEAGFTAKVTAGDFVPKDLSTSLCSQAKLNGIAEGKLAEQKAQADAAAKIVLIETRKTALTTASLPLPEGEVAAFLGASEEDFTKAKTTFAARVEDLKKAQITLAAELLGNLWLDEARYAVFASTVKSIPALKLNHEPLAGEKTAETKAPARMLI